MSKKRLTAEDLVEVVLANDEDFLKIKETLTRMGVASKREKKLWQSCHILHKRGKYYIVHFKELFGLDGLPFEFSDSDVGRRNAIVNLLEEWELLRSLTQTSPATPLHPLAESKSFPTAKKGIGN